MKFIHQDERNHTKVYMEQAAHLTHLFSSVMTGLKQKTANLAGPCKGCKNCTCGKDK